MAQIKKVTDFAASELKIFMETTENQLLSREDPDKGMFIAESPKVLERALDAGYEPLCMLVEEKQITEEAARLITRCPDTPVYAAEHELMQKLTGYPMTRGVLCAMMRRKLPGLEEICSNARRIAVLERVVNPTNLGAIFRSAAALGMDAVLLTSDCCDPLYRRAIRVSMGTVFQIPWTYFGGKYDKSEADSWPSQGLQTLREMGFLTAAMALRDDTIPIDAPVLKEAKRLAVILGTEGDGLSSRTIHSCDYTVKIPMYHGVDSLNVAAASALAFWELGKRRTDR